ncbi:MAG: aminotransferase IV, partial [Saprospiraceae bacterium]|nr:aminotransferase IV [Saprospiraceae bacterium]
MQTYDERNAHIKIFVGEDLFTREEAKVSVFDSVVQGGDAVWEGLRLYEAGIFLLDQHLTRLEESAHAMAYQSIPRRDFIRKSLGKTLEANGMDRDVHIRLT